MQSSLDAFLEHLRSERQVSSHTLDGYRRDLHKILALCEKQAVASWDALDTRTLRAMVARLHIDMLDAGRAQQDLLQRLCHMLDRVGRGHAGHGHLDIDHRHGNLRLFFARNGDRRQQPDENARQQDQRR